MNKNSAVIIMAANFLAISALAGTLNGGLARNHHYKNGLFNLSWLA